MRSLRWFPRSLIVVVVASGSMAAVACASADPGQAPGAAVGMRPGCAGPSVVVRGSPPDHVASTTVTTGKSLSVTVDMTDVAGAHFVSGTLVVARPGSQPDAGDLASIPSDAAALPVNQLASSAASSTGAKTWTATVAWVASARGAYPVVFMGTYLTTADCSGSGPFLSDPSHTMGMATQVATLQVT